MKKPIETKSEIVRIAGKLKEVITTTDDKGRILQKIIKPFMVEFYPRDVVQVIIGAVLLAIPVGFTEETWNLGETLPLANVIGFLILSLLFIAIFVYYNYYRTHLKKHKYEFFKRVISTYIISFLVVAMLLTLIQRVPWTLDLTLALKRTIIVTFPASLSAAIADMIK